MYDMNDTKENDLSCIFSYFANKEGMIELAPVEPSHRFNKV
jgi:hypothetical protein